MTDCKSIADQMHTKHSTANQHSMPIDVSMDTLSVQGLQPVISMYKVVAPAV